MFIILFYTDNNSFWRMDLTFASENGMIALHSCFGHEEDPGHNYMDVAKQEKHGLIAGELSNRICCRR